MNSQRPTDDAATALPHPADPVAHWFEPLLGERLAQADMGTLGALAQRIEAAGARWWYPVRGMGVTRAARVVEWLRAQPGAVGPSMVPAAASAKGRAGEPLELISPPARGAMPSGHPWDGPGPATGFAPLAQQGAERRSRPGSASQPHDWTRQLRALQPVEH